MLTTSERIALVNLANLLREAVRLIGRALLEQDRELAIALIMDVWRGLAGTLDSFGVQA